jgi:hypothetical protein
MTKPRVDITKITALNWAASTDSVSDIGGSNRRKFNPYASRLPTINPDAPQEIGLSALMPPSSCAC